ncbi:MAG: chemotaxis protein CheB [Plectolyngbya sp. WJT66-NPBG17]|jgi:two-component system chemotaxis response regulator CheB|nr:chemotaxis protein CheB [Plectolyngbya sp. WJT66-NPBG17]MBW4528112.1 chemotaxis protein CheB [Phormidium tanganyikae FI6-MK23]
MKGHDIVVIGASAGGVETLTNLVQKLPPDLNAAIFAVLHFPPHAVSVLPNILNRLRTLPACHAEHGTEIEPRRIYLAPPDYHLLIGHDRISLSHGPRENGFRPAVDTLFRSAAHYYRQRVIGIVLSGTLDDGTAGLFSIKEHGGIAIAQDPEEALFAGMPRNAITGVKVDYIWKVPEIAAQLPELTENPIQEKKLMSEEIVHEGEWVQQEKTAIERGERSGLASAFTCPDCGGVLWELRDRNLMRYRCHVGHAYSPESLLAAKDDSLERALWAANRALEEKAALARRMATRAKESNHWMSEAQFSERAQEAEAQAGILRRVLSEQIGLKLSQEDFE